MTLRSCMAGVALMLGLGGCLSSVLPEPAPADSIYRLTPISQTQQPAEDAMVVRVDRPTAPKVLMGQKVVVSPDGRRLAHAGQARWAQAIPDLIQSSFFDMLGTRPGIEAVLPTSGARTDTRVHLTVRNFEAQFDQGPESAPLAIVQYKATLSDAATRNLIGTYDVRKTARAYAPSVSAIVEAQDKANADALAEIADWLEATTSKS